MRLKLILFFTMILSFLIGSQVNAANYSHIINLNPGWNLISTPRIVESHEFSVTETLDNFSIYLLSKDSVSGWQTMAEAGHDEFTPLYGYFIYNNTETVQTLKFNYKQNNSPSERMFSRSLSSGWNIIGIANPSYALKQKSSSLLDTDNIKNILNSISSSTSKVLNLTADSINKSSVSISDSWNEKVFSEANQLDDFRETKAYAVYLNHSDNYDGFQNDDEIFTIDLGSRLININMDKSATPAKEVKPDTKNVVLATMSFESNGENATILSIDGTYLTIEGNDELENIKMVDKSNGATYDFDTTYSSTEYQLSLDEEIYLTKGVTKTFEVRADIVSGASENGTFQVILDSEALEIEGEESGAVIEYVTPGDVSSAITTVKSASLTVSDVSLTNLTVVAGAEDQLVYRANVKAGSADDIRIQSFTVATTSGTGIFNNNNISALSIYLDGKLMTTVSNRINGGEVTFSSLSNNIVKAGKTSVLTIEADFSSSLDAGNFKLAAESMIARSVTGNEALEGLDSLAGAGSREITIAESGELSVDILTDDSSANNDSLVLAGSESDSDNYLGEIKFTTANEDIMVEDLELLASTTLSDITDASIESVKLYDEDGSLIAEQIVETNGDAIFEDVNLTFEADKSTSLFIAITARGINNGDAMATAEAGSYIAYELGDVVAKGVSSAETIDANVGDDATKVATIVGSKLNSIANALADGKLTNGNNRTIAKYTFVFDNGDNQDADNDEVKAYFANLEIEISTSTATATNFQLFIEGEEETKVSGSLVGDEIQFANVTTLDMDGSVTLVITADMDGVGENSWLQTQLDLGTTGNVVYYDSAEGASVPFEASSKVSSSLIDGAYLEN